MIRTVIIVLLLSATAGLCLAGPYPPAADQAGTTAIYKNDPNIVNWASGVKEDSYQMGEGCTDPDYQDPSKALGSAQGIVVDVEIVHDIVCLGKGGEIILTFDGGIGDGQGYDFAVFENGVNNWFLELAYVEVSSDGQNFYRFYSDSLTPAPVLPLGLVYPDNITGLASKYIHSYGTPFDLASLRGVSPLLDVDNVSFVRIIDIVGDGSYLDTSGKPIYDPYPTEGDAGAAGFDLDGIAVMNMRIADLNESTGVCVDDLFIFAAAWLSNKGDGNWNQDCDLAYPKNEHIDLADFAVLSSQWTNDCGGL